MNEDCGKEDSLHLYFAEAIHDSFNHRLGLTDQSVEEYVTAMMVAFLHLDRVFGIRDRNGRPVTAVTDMVTEGDIRFNADSFERERQVHRHIGDFLLFWSGLFPEYLKVLKAPMGRDALLDPVRQGKMSYKVASTFDYPPHDVECKVLRRLSDDFEEYQYGLSLVRASFEGFRLQGWPDGFQA